MSNNSDRPALSVAMIVRDAETIVEETLQSIRQIADEVVVADTGSRDRTRRIVSNFTPRVLDIPWQHDFSAARNACLARTQGDWVLWLDAGESISADTARELRDFVDQEANPDHVYAFLVRLPEFAGSISAQQILQHRLMPRRGDLRFEGRVRESLDVTIQAAGLESQDLRLIIDRHPHDLQPEIRVRKAQRDLRLIEMEMADAGENDRLLLARGTALAILGEPQEARRCFQAARQHAREGSNSLLEAYYGEITTVGTDRDSRAVQIDMCIEALEAFPVDVQLLCSMAGLLQAHDRVDLAIRTYETAVKCGRLNRHVWHLADMKDIALVCWTAALQIAGRESEAETLLEDAIVEKPRSFLARHQLIELLVAKQRRDEALQHTRQLPLVRDQRESLYNAVRGACLAKSGDWIAAEAYLETAYESGCRDPICCRWLILAWTELGKTIDAGRVLHAWQAVDPHNPEIDALSERLRASAGETVGPADELEVDGGRQIRIHQPTFPGMDAPPPPKAKPGLPASRSSVPDRSRIDR